MLIFRRFHFDSIAHDNDATSSNAASVQIPTIPSDPSSSVTPLPILLEGTQEVKKFNRQVADEVRILLALYRIDSKKVDIVFSANLPLKTETGGMGPEELERTKSAFMAAAQSFRILDFGLFA